MLLEKLQEDLGTIDVDGFAPEDKIEKGETVIGTLPHELRPLYALSCKAINDVRAFAEKAHTRVMEELGGPENLSPEEHDSLTAEITALDAYAMLVDKAFWAEVRATSGRIDPRRPIGLRRNWQVVYKNGIPFPAIVGIIAVPMPPAE